MDRVDRFSSLRMVEKLCPACAEKMRSAALVVLSAMVFRSAAVLVVGSSVVKYSQIAEGLADDDGFMCDYCALVLQTNFGSRLIGNPTTSRLA